MNIRIENRIYSIPHLKDGLEGFLQYDGEKIEWCYMRWSQDEADTKTLQKIPVVENPEDAKKVWFILSECVGSEVINGDTLYENQQALLEMRDLKLKAGAAKREVEKISTQMQVEMHRHEAAFGNNQVIDLRNRPLGDPTLFGAMSAIEKSGRVQ